MRFKKIIIYGNGGDRPGTGEPFNHQLVRYTPCLMQWTQPDTLVLEPYNLLDWNSYGLNNPSRYTDPSGHWPFDFPDWLNPFSLDTFTFSGRGALKYYSGVEGDITANIYIKPIKEKGKSGLSEVEGSASIEGAVSLGLSAQLKGAAVLGSVEGKLDEQSGSKLFGIDQYAGTAAVCSPNGICGGIIGSTNLQGKPTSKGVLIGLGEGYDISADLVQVSGWVFKGNKNGLSLQVPILNKKFLEKAKITYDSFVKTLGNRLIK